MDDENNIKNFAQQQKQHDNMIRLIDFFASLFGLILLSPVILVLYIAGLFDTGSPIFRQQRVGQNQQPFTLIKFRTMT